MVTCGPGLLCLFSNTPAEVGARAERASGASEHDHADRGYRARSARWPRAVRLPMASGERVHGLRPVQRDPGRGAALFEQDGGGLPCSFVSLACPYGIVVRPAQAGAGTVVGNAVKGRSDLRGSFLCDDHFAPQSCPHRFRGFLMQLEQPVDFGLPDVAAAAVVCTAWLRMRLQASPAYRMDAAVILCAAPPLHRCRPRDR